MNYITRQNILLRLTSPDTIFVLYAFFSGTGIFLCLYGWSLKDTVKKYLKKRRGPREGISTGPQGGSSGAFYVWGSGTDCFWGKQLQIWEGTTFAVLKYTIL